MLIINKGMMLLAYSPFKKNSFWSLALISLRLSHLDLIFCSFKGGMHIFVYNSKVKEIFI